MSAGWERSESPIAGVECWQKMVEDGHLSVFIGQEHHRSGPVWHLSISHRQMRQGGHPKPGRYPTWDELVDARYMFCPEDVVMAQLLPPREEYVNIHSTTFHLWQVPDDLPG